MEQTMVPQVDATNPNPTPDAKAMALPEGSTMDQLRAVAKEMNIPLTPEGNIAETQETAQPASEPKVESPPQAQVQAAPPAHAPAEVPKKFQNPDGTVNVEKLEKSTKSVEEMLAYYRGKEAEAQKAQNRVNNPPPNPQAPQTFVPPQGLSPLEVQAAQDILADAQALGHKMTQNEAILMARAQVRMNEARLNAELNATEDIRRELNETKLTTELQGLMNRDPELLTPQTADRLVELRNELRKQNPNASYRDAYVLHLGQLELQRRTGQVLTPNPTGQTVKAPPTPVGPVSRVQGSVDLSNPKALPDDILLAEIRKIHPNFRNL
jgi:hypothetical protein